jgi:hypothetical protein
MDRCGVDMVLVGDSLGNVLQGHSTTLPVTLVDIAHQTASTTNRHCDAEVTLRFRQNLLDGFLEGFDGLCAGQQVAIIKDD